MASLIFNWKLVEAESRIFKESSDVGSNSFQTRDRNPQEWEPWPQTSSRVFYKFSCAGYSACYIGEINRHFATRIREHLASDKHSHIFKQLRD